MTKEQIFHITRVLKEHLKNEQIIIVGSQSLFGALKEEAENIKNVKISREIDVIINNITLNNKINFIIGELSTFDNTYGYYVDPIFENEIKLPKNFKNRLVNFQTNENLTIQMLNIHDYIVCKLFVGREKDLELLKELSENKKLKIDYFRLEKIIEEYPENNQTLIKIVKDRLNQYFKKNEINFNLNFDL